MKFKGEKVKFSKKNEENKTEAREKEIKLPVLKEVPAAMVSCVGLHGKVKDRVGCDKKGQDRVRLGMIGSK